MEKYNNDEIEYEETLLDKAYEILERAEEAKNDKEAIRLAKESYKLTNECFDALLFQLPFEENSFKKMELLEKGLELEKKRLEKENYFIKGNIGHFYSIFETRPYIRGLYAKTEILIETGRIKEAIKNSEEILKLNNNDNLGTRYILLSLYAYMEDEVNALKLYNKYKEDSLLTDFPLFVLYYKLGDDVKTKKYLNKSIGANKNLVVFFKGKLKKEPDIFDDYYSIGKPSEVIVCIRDNMFLISNIYSELKEYALNNINKK